MSHKLPNDPKKFGPGMWISIHILAYHAKNKEINFFIVKL